MRSTAAIALLVLLAGCLGGPAGSGTPATPTAPAETMDPSSAVDCGHTWVSFWGTSEPDLWAPDEVRLGYTLPRNGTHVVAYENGAVVGQEYLPNPGGVHADGADLALDRPLSGTHTLQVVLHRDDGDGTFERGEDPPCLSADGDPAATEKTAIDFDRFDTEDGE